jgi:hypothetical protein
MSDDFVSAGRSDGACPCLCTHGIEEHDDRGRCGAMVDEDPLPGGGTKKTYCDCPGYVPAPAKAFDVAAADRQIRATWAVEKGSNRRNMVIGWHAAHLKAENGWQKLGYADEAAYRDAVGVSHSVWGRYTRIAGAFPRLALEQFAAMTAENAETLATLPEASRYDPEWLRQAREMKAEDFRRQAIAVAAEAMGVPAREMRVSYRVRVFDGQRTVIENAVKEFMRENGIRDEGTALEWMAMEQSGRKTFARFLGEQLPVLRKALRDGDPKTALEAHVVAMAAMLEALRAAEAR